MQKEKPIAYSKMAPWIVLGLMVFVVILSAFYFSRQSLRLDEAQSLWQTSRTPTKILTIVAQDVHVPLYHFILHFWQLFLGNSVVTGRILSLIFFILSIPALYFLGKRTFGKSAAIFAATLFAVSPFMNWYGNEIRMYSLLTLLTILSQYFFVGIYKTRESESWIGYFVVALFGIFTHYFFWFVILVQALFYLSYRNLFPKGSFKRFCIILVILLIVFSPWLIYKQSLSGSAADTTPLLVIPNTVNVFNTFSQFLFGFQNDHLNTILVSLWPLTVLLGFLALRENERISPDAIYMLMALLIPIALAFIVSVVLIPVFVSRYLILTIPALYLFISWVFSTYPLSLQRVIKTTLIVGMFAGLVVEIMSPSAPVKEDYRTAAEYLQSHTTPQDVVVLSAPFTVYPVEYYYRGTAEIQTLPYWNRFNPGAIPGFNEPGLEKDVNNLKIGHEKAYVLLSYDQGYEEKIRLYMDTHFERIEMKNFSPGLTLYVYRLSYVPSIFSSTQSSTPVAVAITQ